MRSNKATGKDGITSEVYKSAFKIFPRYITALYNACLPNEVEKNKVAANY